MRHKQQRNGRLFGLSVRDEDPRRATAVEEEAIETIQLTASESRQTLSALAYASRGLIGVTAIAVAALTVYALLYAAFAVYMTTTVFLRLYLLRSLYRKFLHIWPSPYAHAQRPNGWSLLDALSFSLFGHFFAIMPVSSLYSN